MVELFAPICVGHLVLLRAAAVPRHREDGTATIDMMYARKQPDWSYGAIDSGIPPAELYTDTPVSVTV